MKDIVKICEEQGITIPDDKAEAFKKSVAENYKTVAEFDKKVAKLEAERDGFKERAESAEDSLKNFDGVNVEDYKKQIADANEKVKQAEADYKAKIEARDIADAISSELAKYKFTSTSAQNAIKAEIEKSGLKLSDGKLLGLNDLVAQLKEKDPTAFVDEKQAQAEQNKAKFTTAGNGAKSETKITKEDIMKITDRSERRKAIAEHPEVFSQLSE